MAHSRMPKTPCSPPHSITTTLDSRLDLPGFTARFYVAPKYVGTCILILGRQSENAIARRCGVLDQLRE
jgi:hypothetical protein